MGEDYRLMMFLVDQNVIDKKGSIGDTSIKKVAMSQGYELEELDRCKLEGNLVVCKEMDYAHLSNNWTYETLVTVYNSNLKPQKGFFVMVPRHLSKVRASRIRWDQEPDVRIDEDSFEEVQAETLCPTPYFGDETQNQYL